MEKQTKIKGSRNRAMVTTEGSRLKFHKQKLLMVTSLRDPKHEIKSKNKGSCAKTQGVAPVLEPPLVLTFTQHWPKSWLNF